MRKSTMMSTSLMDSWSHRDSNNSDATHPSSTGQKNRTRLPGQPKHTEPGIPSTSSESSGLVIGSPVLPSVPPPVYYPYTGKPLQYLTYSCALSRASFPPPLQAMWEHLQRLPPGSSFALLITLASVVHVQYDGPAIPTSRSGVGSPTPRWRSLQYTRPDLGLDNLFCLDHVPPPHKPRLSCVELPEEKDIYCAEEVESISGDGR